MERGWGAELNLNTWYSGAYGTVSGGHIWFNEVPRAITKLQYSYCDLINTYYFKRTNYSAWAEPSDWDRY